MFMKYNLFILFIILLSNCVSKKEEQIINTNLVQESKNLFLKNFKSSSNSNNIRYVLNMNNQKTWNSISTGKNEIILMEFESEIYIKKINISSIVNKKYDNIESLSVVSNKGIVGVFDINNDIIINDIIKFLIIQIENTSNSKFVNAFKNEINYKIDNKNHTKVAINNISFWKNDSCKYLTYSTRQAVKHKKTTKYEFINKKYIDYTNSKKSIILNSDFTFSFLNENKKEKNIIFGEWCFLEEKVGFHKIKLWGENYLINSELSKTNFLDTISISNTEIFGNQIGIIHTDFPDDVFVVLNDLDSSLIFDVRYATDNNFTNTILYECDKCLLRYGVAKDLIKANNIFKEKGFRLKIFDAYRPQSVQYKMWEVCPNKNYVAKPEKGSIHNRGAAVDLTLVDTYGKQLDMGTTYDFFGYKAFTTNFDLSDTIINNRLVLQTVLAQCNFNKIKTEWWHFSHRTCMQYEIANFPLPCD